MSAWRRRGFTLIELLVVIAIIGILAAMLFPVFAKARESARKIQCLSNVKNLAMAVQLYLAEWDRFPPGENRQEVCDYFLTQPGGGPVSGMHCDDPTDPEGGWWAASVANPYLQWPVLLDDYAGSRDIWRCPSASMEAAASFIYYDGGNWLGYLQNNEGSWGAATGIGPLCTHMAFPSGWGGEVTDSIGQQMIASPEPGSSGLKATKVFIQSIGCAKENLMGKNLSSIGNPAGLIVVADNPVPADWLSIARIAYPNICCAECAGIGPWVWAWPPADEDYCGYCDDCFPIHANISWAKDPDRMKGSTRHLGGSNVGFGDGHAKWYSAKAIIAASDERNVEGVGWVCPSSAKRYQKYCGTPDPEMLFIHNEDIGWEGY